VQEVEQVQWAQQARLESLDRVVIQDQQGVQGLGVIPGQQARQDRLDHKDLRVRLEILARQGTLVQPEERV